MENDLKPMTRDQIKDVLGLVDKVSGALRDLPYRDAVGPMKALGEIIDIISEPLPGHEAVICPGCEELCGIDEMSDCGDETFCNPCIDRMNRP